MSIEKHVESYGDEDLFSMTFRNHFQSDQRLFGNIDRGDAS